MGLKRLRVFVEGRVQGVFFRASTREEAKRRALCGWVRNLPDGRVETEFEGEAQEVDKMLLWLAHGPQTAEVRNVTKSDCLVLANESQFEIRY